MNDKPINYGFCYRAFREDMILNYRHCISLLKKTPVDNEKRIAELKHDIEYYANIIDNVSELAFIDIVKNNPFH